MGFSDSVRCADQSSIAPVASNGPGAFSFYTFPFWMPSTFCATVYTCLKIARTVSIGEMIQMDRHGNGAIDRTIQTETGTCLHQFKDIRHLEMKSSALESSGSRKAERTVSKSSLTKIHPDPVLAFH